MLKRKRVAIVSLLLAVVMVFEPYLSIVAYADDLSSEENSDDNSSEENTHAHTFNEPTFNWSDNLQYCTASFKCKDCDFVLDVPCDINDKDIQYLKDDKCLVSYVECIASAKKEYKGFDTSNNGSEYTNMQSKGFGYDEGLKFHEFKSEWVTVASSDKTDKLFDNADNKDFLSKDEYDKSDSTVLKRICCRCREAYILQVIPKDSYCKVRYFAWGWDPVAVAKVKEGSNISLASVDKLYDSFDADANEVSKDTLDYYSDVAVVDKLSRQATKYAVGKTMDVYLIPKTDTYSTTYVGRKGTASSGEFRTDLLVKKATFGNSSAITLKDIQEHPELKKWNVNVEKYMDSESLNSNIKYSYSDSWSRDNQCSLQANVVMTYKDFDTDSVLHTEIYPAGYGEIHNSDFSDPDFDGYYPIPVNKNSYGKWELYADGISDISYDRNIYVMKKSDCYTAKIHVKDSDGNSLSDDFSFMFGSNNYVREGILPATMSCSYDEKSDTFISDLMPKTTSGTDYLSLYYKYYNGYLPEGSYHDGWESGTLDIKFSNDLKTVTNVSAAFDNGVFKKWGNVEYTWDADSNILDINLTVNKLKFTENHVFFDKDGNEVDKVVKTYDVLPYTYVAVYPLKRSGYVRADSIPGYSTYMNDTDDQEFTFKYHQDDNETYKNGIVCNYKDINGNIGNDLSNKYTTVTTLYNDNNTYENFSTDIADGKYKLKAHVHDSNTFAIQSDYPEVDIANVVVTGGAISLTPIENRAFKVTSYSNDNGIMSIDIEQIPCRINYIDHYWGINHLRYRYKFPYGYDARNRETNRFLKMIGTYRNWAVDGPSDSDFPTSLTSDITLDYWYEPRALKTSTVKVKVLDSLENNKHGLEVTIGDEKAMEKSDGTYAVFAVPDGTSEIKVNGTTLGNVTVNNNDDTLNKFNMDSNCSAYRFVSAEKTRDQELTVTVKSVAKTLVNVVDRYDGEAHLRQSDEYNAGETYSYNALTKEGYTVDNQVLTGTVENDAITVVFNYTKSSNNDHTPTPGTTPSPTPTPTPTPDPTPTPSPTPDPTPSNPEVKKVIITVVDHYNGEDHVRTVDTYDEGTRWMYDALDIEGYTVFGDSEKEGFALADTTVTFNYMKDDGDNLIDITPKPSPEDKDTLDKKPVTPNKDKITDKPTKTIKQTVSTLAPKTGDTSEIYVYILLGLVGLVIMFGALAMREDKRKKKKN